MTTPLAAPLAFQATPVALGSDAADVTASFTPVRDVCRANFALINSFAQPNTPVFGRSAQINQPVFNYTGLFTDFPSGNWPPVTITLPPRVTALILGFAGHVEYVVNPAWHVAVSARISGAGYTGPAIDTTAFVQRSQYNAVAAGREMTIPAAQLKGGQSVTITPQYALKAPSGSSQIYVHVDNFTLYALALV